MSVTDVAVPVTDLEAVDNLSVTSICPSFPSKNHLPMTVVTDVTDYVDIVDTREDMGRTCVSTCMARKGCGKSVTRHFRHGHRSEGLQVAPVYVRPIHPRGLAVGERRRSAAPSTRARVW